MKSYHVCRKCHKKCDCPSSDYFKCQTCGGCEKSTKIVSEFWVKRILKETKDEDLPIVIGPHCCGEAPHHSLCEDEVCDCPCHENQE